MCEVSRILALEVYKDYGENADKEIIKRKFEGNLTDEQVKKVYQCYLELLIKKDFTGEI